MISTGTFCPCWRATLTSVRAGSETAPHVPYARVARARLAGLVLTCLLASPVPGRAQTAPLFRLFLTNGKVVTCLGEYTRASAIAWSSPCPSATARSCCRCPRTSWTGPGPSSTRTRSVPPDTPRRAARPISRRWPARWPRCSTRSRLPTTLDASCSSRSTPGGGSRRGRVTTTTTKPATSGRSSSSWTRPSRKCARPPASSSSISASRPTSSRPRCRCCQSPPSPSR